MFTHRTLLVVVAVLIASLYSSHGSELRDDGPAKRLLDDTFLTLSSKVEALTNEVQDIKAQVARQTHPPTAFNAFLTTTITGGQKQVIVFDQVTTNIGNAYNNHHGNFLAPVNGTYLFTLYACSASGHANVLDLMKNGNTVERFLSGDASYTECTSRTFLVYLVVGDDVYVQEGTYGDSLYVIPNYGRPSFSGVLIQAH